MITNFKSGLKNLSKSPVLPKFSQINPVKTFYKFIKIYKKSELRNENKLQTSVKIAGAAKIIA
jgi:hypothetical protein